MRRAVSKQDQMLRFFPFLQWLGELRHWQVLRADLIAGLTVAMFLIPQSMAYAKLAGMPAYYGLYAGFLPPIIAALFGSSRILSTGPIALTSLLTAAALQPIAVSGSDEYLQFIFMFTLLAGAIQLALGLLRLGVVINFLSYPVLLGFINAAALIIASAQFSSILGVSAQSWPYYYQTVLQVLQDARQDIHWPTFAMALLALVIMLIGRRWRPKSPYVLIALIVTTMVAWLTHFDRTEIIEPKQIISMAVAKMVNNILNFPVDMDKLQTAVSLRQKQLDMSIQGDGDNLEKSEKALELLNQAKWRLERRLALQQTDDHQLHRIRLRRVKDRHEGYIYFVADEMTPIGHVDKRVWRIASVDVDGVVHLQAGGHVVGAIPGGLPSFAPVSLGWDMAPRLFISALVISLLGFVQAITIAKRIATNNRQQLDVNQEFIGQGLANLLGGFFQSMPVSGGFTRSAINHEVGARTGFSSVVSGLVVMVVLLWFTRLFYYVPEGTLAAIILVTVLGLVDFKAMYLTWIINRNEGVVALLTFLMTMFFAPRLEFALLLGMLLSLGVYLHETMHPKFSELLRAADGDLIEVEVRDTEEDCPLLSVLRFGGSLYFANVAYFEDKIISLMLLKPKLRYVILDCARMNKLDASGLETLRSIHLRFHEAGLEFWLTRVPQGVMKILKRGGFYESLGAKHFFKHNEDAIAMFGSRVGAHHMRHCPLARPHEK